MRAHAAARRPCRHLRNSTAEQPSNRGLKRFQYPVAVRGSSPVEIEANDSKVLEDADPESEHWRGLQLDPNHRLLIRRSLVRAQVGEPIKSKGYVARRNPFLFAILESGSTSCASSLSPIATPRPSSAPSTERPRTRLPAGSPAGASGAMSACGCGAKGQAFAAFDLSLTSMASAWTAPSQRVQSFAATT